MYKRAAHPDRYGREDRMLEKITAAQTYGPVVKKLRDMLRKPMRTGRALTKKQGKEIRDFLMDQAPLVWGHRFDEAIENNDVAAQMAVLRELIALDIEEVKVGKKTIKKKKEKPSIRVYMPKVNEETQEVVQEYMVEQP